MLQQICACLFYPVSYSLATFGTVCGQPKVTKILCSYVHFTITLVKTFQFLALWGHSLSESPLYAICSAVLSHRQSEHLLKTFVQANSGASWRHRFLYTAELHFWFIFWCRFPVYI